MISYNKYKVCCDMKHCVIAWIFFLFCFFYIKKETCCQHQNLLLHIECIYKSLACWAFSRRSLGGESPWQTPSMHDPNMFALATHKPVEYIIHKLVEYIIYKKKSQWAHTAENGAPWAEEHHGKSRGAQLLTVTQNKDDKCVFGTYQLLHNGIF